ncbi:MAG: HlyD family efflux transporter periplasmic adaptor subunit [Bacteroidetes bacterium]|nr:HlyD family efflux transporter periplasmic adaptor subunit [Bacteroidota bacterium]
MISDKTKLLFKWLSREKKVVYNIYALAMLQGVLYMTIPLTIQGIITYTMAGRFSASLVLLSLLTLAVILFIGLLQLWQMRLNETLQERIFCNLTERIAMVTGNERGVHKKIAHFFEVVTLQKGIGKILLDFSFSVISVVFGILLLPAYSNWFFLFSVVLGVVFYLIIACYGKRAQNANLNTSTQKYQIFATLSSGELHEAQIDAELNRYIDYRKEYYHAFEKQYKGILFFKILFAGVLLFFGAYLVQAGELNIGQFVASEVIILLVINSVEKLVSGLGTCYDMVTGLYKLELLFEKNPQESYLRSEETNYLRATAKVYRPYFTRPMKWMFYALLLAFGVTLFLPWTQSVSMSGEVSVLNPENKPQQVTSRIAGRIEKWFIRDGDFVKKNDTIAFISEIKEEYMDSLLVQRSEAQVKSKEVSLRSYESKTAAINNQIDAINKSLRLKTEQIKNKIIQIKAKLASDSAEVKATAGNYKVAEEQMKRFEELLSKGVISKTELENRKVKVQEVYARRIAAENKVIATKNELLIAEIELHATTQEYNEKLMKAESDKFSTISMYYEAEGSLTKLQNQLSNYALRNTYYYVLAPQDGYVNNMALKGIGEIVKEGGMICNIVPVQKEQAVELYIDPVDLPLIEKGQTVQLIFDGWPAFVFSGWPGLSYGSFSAEIVTFDKAISSNGKFRVLAINKGNRWPDAIQIGGGVKGFALLRNVPLVYELWRKANGFPPEFYKTKNKVKNDAVSDKK